MEWLKDILGDDTTYNKVVEKLGKNTLLLVKEGEKYLLDDGKLIPKARLDEVADQKKALQEQVTDLNKSIADLKKATKDNEGLQTKLTEIQNQMQDKEKAIQNLTKKQAVREALLTGKAKQVYIDLLEGKISLDKVEVDENGKLKDPDAHLKPLRESYKELFGEMKIEGAPPRSPDNNFPTGLYTEEELSRMTPQEMKKNIDKVNKSFAYLKTLEQKN